MGNLIVCIYHANCADGFGSAYAVWKKFGDECEYIAASYGHTPPDVTGKCVYMVDFSYPRDVLLDMAREAASIVILDHHDTAEKELVDLPSNVQVVFDQDQSGAAITWRFLHRMPMPHLLAIVQDRDLWRFNMHGTKEVTAALFSQDWTFELWDKWCSCPAEVKALKNEGIALLRKHDKDVAALCEPHNVDTAKMNLPGYGTVELPMVNCPWMYASDVGHTLCKKYPDAPLSLTYMVMKDHVKFSARSEDKYHCGKLAKVFNGGGHPNAAGFSMSREYFASCMLEGEKA